MFARMVSLTPEGAIPSGAPFGLEELLLAAVVDQLSMPIPLKLRQILGIKKPAEAGYDGAHETFDIGDALHRDDGVHGRSFLIDQAAAFRTLGRLGIQQTLLGRLDFSNSVPDCLCAYGLMLPRMASYSAGARKSFGPSNPTALPP